MGRNDPSLYTAAEMARMAFVLGLEMFGDEQLQLHGVTYVETLRGFSMLKAATTIKKQSDPEHKRLLSFGLDTMPFRIRALYVIEQPTWFSWFWGVIKFFFKKKLRDRLVLLGKDLTALHAVVPPAGLPEEYGGSLAEPPGAYLDRLEARVAAAGGMLGGFQLPLRMDDPTGAVRRAEAAGAGGGGGGGGAAGGSGGAAGGGGSDAAAEGEGAEAPSSFAIE